MNKASHFMLATESVSREQQALVEAIFAGGNSQEFDPRGIAIYRRNLQAAASRALQISFPTVLKLIGEDLFDYATKQLLLVSAPNQGDWGVWGEGFANLLGELPQLTEYPFIADCARLDFARHLSARAADSIMDISSLELLVSVNLDQLAVTMHPSVRLMASDYPIVDIWDAHQVQPDLSKQYLAKAQARMAEGSGRQYAMVYRPYFKAQVCELDEAEYKWLILLQQGFSVGKALDCMEGVGFTFDNFLRFLVEEKSIIAFRQLDGGRSALVSA